MFCLHNTVKVRSSANMLHETLESFGLYHLGPLKELRPIAWIRKLNINLDTTYNFLDLYLVFLRSLLLCPSLRMIQIDIGVNAEHPYWADWDQRLYRATDIYEYCETVY